jgi:ketosteroid isomerase-like protein
MEHEVEPDESTAVQRPGMHPNEAVVRELWGAISDGNAERVASVLAPDVLWRSYEAGDLSGDRYGPEPVLDLLAIAGEWVDTMSLDLVDVYANDRGAVMHYRVRARRGAQELDTQVLIVFEVESGLVVSAYSVPLDPAANGAFWRASIDTAGTTH